jgi:ankyrin repeat protein
MTSKMESSCKNPSRKESSLEKTAREVLKATKELSPTEKAEYRNTLFKRLLQLSLSIGIDAEVCTLLNIDATDNTGQTELIFAAKEGHTNVVKTLVRVDPGPSPFQ